MFSYVTMTTLVVRQRDSPPRRLQMNSRGNLWRTSTPVISDEGEGNLVRLQTFIGKDKVFRSWRHGNWGTDSSYEEPPLLGHSLRGNQKLLDVPPSPVLPPLPDKESPHIGLHSYYSLLRDTQTLEPVEGTGPV